MDFLPEIPLGLPTLDGFDSDDESSVVTAATAASVHSIQQLSQCIPLRGDAVIEGGENKVLKQNLQASSQVLEAAEGEAAAGEAGAGGITPEAAEAILTATFVTTASASQPIVEQIQQSGSCAAGGGSGDKRKREEDSQVSALSYSGDERDTNRQRTGSYATQSLGTDTEDEDADEAAVMEDEDNDEEGTMLRGMFGHNGGRRTRHRRRNVTKAKRGKGNG